MYDLGLPPRPFRDALGVALRAALFAALLTALSDLGITWVRGDEPPSADALLGAAGALVGFYGAAATIVGGLFAVIGGGILATVGKWPSARDLLWALGQDEPRDHAQAAGIAAAALALGFVALV